MYNKRSRPSKLSNLLNTHMQSFMTNSKVLVLKDSLYSPMLTLMDSVDLVPSPLTEMEAVDQTETDSVDLDPPLTEADSVDPPPLTEAVLVDLDPPPLTEADSVDLTADVVNLTADAVDLTADAVDLTTDSVDLDSPPMTEANSVDLDPPPLTEM